MIRTIKGAALCGALFVSSLCQALPHTDMRSVKVYDFEAAAEVCDALALDPIEGVWIYPEDNVTVLVRRLPSLSPSALPEYKIEVVATSDVRLRPGDEIGHMKATAEASKYEVSLYTERKNGVLQKPSDCLATLDKDAETIILKKPKRKFNFRFTFNPSLILPKFWRVVRFNSGLGEKSTERPASGMIKVYPSYDGDGSSRRSPRYL